eukprot:Clim_evm19s84 gene=Clim_evmTU19s84
MIQPFVVAIVFFAILLVPAVAAAICMCKTRNILLERRTGSWAAAQCQKETEGLPSTLKDKTDLDSTGHDREQSTVVDIPLDNDGTASEDLGEQYIPPKHHTDTTRISVA